MNHQPLVSVIMIFFNEENFIEEAIAILDLSSCHFLQIERTSDSSLDFV